jgi:hypothetical protein
MMSAADFLVMPEIFWAAECTPGNRELIARRSCMLQLKTQRNNRTSNSVMKYTQPAIAISATLKKTPSKARSLIFVKGSAARAF